MAGGRHPRLDRALVGLAMRRRKQRPLVKGDRSYTVEEVARAKLVHKGTVRTWLKTGLRPIDGRRPTMILGHELNRFAAERRSKSRSPCPPGTLYCVCCRLPKAPAGSQVEYLPLATTSGNLRGRCPDCGRHIHRRVALASIDLVSAGLTVTYPEGHHSIGETSSPSSNTDSNDRGSHGQDV